LGCNQNLIINYPTVKSQKNEGMHSFAIKLERKTGADSSIMTIGEGIDAHQFRNVLPMLILALII
jgi:hypothetical protein